MSDAQPDFSVC